MIMDDFIPVNEPLLDGNEKKYLAECIDSGFPQMDRSCKFERLLPLG